MEGAMNPTLSVMARSGAERPSTINTGIPLTSWWTAAPAFGGLAKTNYPTAHW